MIWTAMPEASADIYNDPRRAKHDVCLPPKAGQQLSVQPETQPPAVQLATKSDLRPSVA